MMLLDCAWQGGATAAVIQSVRTLWGATQAAVTTQRQQGRTGVHG